MVRVLAVVGVVRTIRVGVRSREQGAAGAAGEGLGELLLSLLLLLLLLFFSTPVQSRLSHCTWGRSLFENRRSVHMLRSGDGCGMCTCARVEVANFRSGHGFREVH